jgi:hypothetical protein
MTVTSQFGKQPKIKHNAAHQSEAVQWFKLELEIIKKTRTILQHT